MTPGRKLADMEPVLAKVAAWDYSQKQIPLYEFTAFLREAIGSKSELPQIEARLVKMLGPPTTIPGKDYVCRQLSLIGTRTCVPALARLLNDAATFEMARYALTRIPEAAAVDALRSALPKTLGKARIGIINSLGERREAKSIGPLKALLSSSDSAVSDAAFDALARIGGAEAAAAINAARRGLTGPRRERASTAYLRCADPKAWRDLLDPAEPEMVRVGALHGLVATEGRAAISVLAREMASSTTNVQAAAIRLLSTIPGAEVTALFVERFPNLAPLAQIRVLAALTDRDDAATARPIVVHALGSGSPEVRAEALRALGKVGDASSVPLLAEAAANTEEPARSTARSSLSMLNGPGAEAALISSIDSSAGKVQLELIRAAGERGSTGAADALMRAAKGDDRTASRESVRALRTLAGPAQAQPLLELVLGLRNAAERRDAAVTLAAVIRRSGKTAIGPVLEAYRSSANLEDRALLLEVMGQVSAGETLPVLRAALQDPAPEIARAAILALTAWQAPDPIPDLFAVAKTDSNPARQILAVRGLIKLIQVPSDRSPEDTVRLLGEAMQLAKQPQEKRLVLSALPNYPVKPAFVLAEAALEEAAIAREAKAALDQLVSVRPQ